jgi:hypothetical protein
MIVAQPVVGIGGAPPNPAAPPDGCATAEQQTRWAAVEKAVILLSMVYR